jgi:hypothetical protein
MSFVIVKPLPPHLSYDQLNTLSPQARRLYEVVYARLETSEFAYVWMGIQEATRKARISPSELEAAQLELLHSGFVYLHQGERDMKYQLTPPEKQGRRTGMIGKIRKPLGSRGASRSMGRQGSGWRVIRESETLVL